MKKVISACILLLIVSSCARRQDDVKYAEDPDHGLIKEVRVGNMMYTVQYKSPAFVAAKEHLDSAATRERELQLKGMIWFNISFQVKDFGQSPLRYKISGLEEYNERQNYYLNQAPGDIYLLYGRDSLFVDSYWFENNQNLAPFETMVVGFRLPSSDSIPRQDLKLSFYDRVYKNGIIRTVIRKEDINDQIKL